jgi:Bacterial self-protective colicin-like immunity
MISLTDKIQLQKYIYILTLYCHGQIGTTEFEKIFLQTRRDDNYLMSGLFDKNIEQILSTFFLDVDAYCGDPEIANYDSSDPFSDIDEQELKKRAKHALQQLLVHSVPSGSSE